jgi:putative ABC transport system permease protein
MFNTSPGYDARHVLVAPLRFPVGGTAGSATLLVRNILERVEGLPGVIGATRSDGVPFFTPNRGSVKLADRGVETATTVELQTAGPGYLRTLGIPIVRGRDFRTSEPPGRAVIPESLARQISPDRDPIGRTLEALEGPRYEIIGVAKDVRTGESDAPVVHVLDAFDRRQTFLLIHFNGDARAAQEAVRAAARDVRPDIVLTPRTLQSRIDDGLADTWRVVALILLLGLVAMALSVAGIYGVVSFAVSRKTHEIGVRLALGAQKLDIFREVLVSSAKPVLLGLFLGLWMALAADSAIRSIFQGTPVQLDSANPAVYLGSASVLALAALAAMLVPARRGARSDPMKALRYD